MTDKVRTLKIDTSLEMNNYLRGVYELENLVLYKEGVNSEHYGVGYIKTSGLSGGYFVGTEDDRTLEPSLKYEMIKGSAIPDYVILDNKRKGSVGGIRVSINPYKLNAIIREESDRDSRNKLLQEAFFRESFDGVISGVTYIDGDRYLVIESISSFAQPTTLEFLAYDDSALFPCFITENKEEEALFQLNIDIENSPHKVRLYEVDDIASESHTKTKEEQVPDTPDEQELEDDYDISNNLDDSLDDWEIDEDDDGFNFYLKQDGAFGALKEGERVNVKNEHFVLEEYEVEEASYWFHNPNTIEDRAPLLMVVNEEGVIDYLPKSLIGKIR